MIAYWESRRREEQEQIRGQKTIEETASLANLITIIDTIIAPALQEVADLSSQYGCLFQIHSYDEGDTTTGDLTTPQITMTLIRHKEIVQQNIPTPQLCVFLDKINDTAVCCSNETSYKNDGSFDTEDVVPAHMITSELVQKKLNLCLRELMLGVKSGFCTNAKG
jgi:hypothetical protein